MVPIDIDVFMADPQVKEVIESTKLKVKIDETSDDYASLTAENGKISGLTSGRYYMVEEYDESLDFKGTLFVQTNGTTWGDLSLIGSLTGKQIINLKNNYTYKVKYAKPFIGGNMHTYFAFGDTSAKKADLSTGSATIRGAKDYYLNVGTVINSVKNYQLMKIPIPGLDGTNTPWGNSKTSANYTGSGNVFDLSGNYIKFDTNREIGIYQYRNSVLADPPPQKLNLNLQDMSLIALTGINTQSDYVFAEYDNDKISNFIVLTINRLDETIVNITVEITYTSENSPSVAVTTPSTPSSPGNNYSFSQNVNQDIVISATDPTNNYTKIEWYKDDVTIPATGTNFTFSLNTNVIDANNKQAGTHQITAVGYKDGIPYSTIINITITP